MKNLYLLLLLISSFSFYTFSQEPIGNVITGNENNPWYHLNVELSDNGKILAIIGRDEDNIATLSIYRELSGEWVKDGIEAMGEIETTKVSGFSLSGDGSTLVYGGGNDDIKIFEYKNGSWQLKGNPINGEWLQNQIPRLSYDGSILAIGTRCIGGGQAPRLCSGWVDFYQFETGEWTSTGTIAGDITEEELGRYISISKDGSVVAIGSLYATKVYENIEGSWTLIGSAILGETEHWRIDLSDNGRVLVIAESGYSGNFIYQGRVTVYEFIDGNWAQLGNSLLGDIDYASLGSDVGISGTGQTIAVGSSGNPGNNSRRTNTTSLYQLQNNLWTSIGHHINGEPSEDYSGIALSLSRDARRIATGNKTYEGGANDIGLVRVYDLSLFLTEKDDNTLGLTEFDKAAIKIFPNPGSDKVEIIMPSGKDIIEVSIYSLLGQEMLSTKNNHLDVSNFAKGAYLLKITSQDGILTKKLLVD